MVNHLESKALVGVPRRGFIGGTSMTGTQSGLAPQNALSAASGTGFMISAATMALLSGPARAAPLLPFLPPEGVTAFRLVFVTADTITPATLTAPDAIATYNSFVTTEASQNTNLPATTWSAIVSTSGISAASNIDCGTACDALPIYLVDSATQVATSQANLFGGAPSNFISLDQFGTSSAGYVWTGSTSSGAAAPGATLGTDRPEIGYDRRSPFWTGLLIDAAASGYPTDSNALPEPASGTALLAGGLAVIGIFRPRRRAA